MPFLDDGADAAAAVVGHLGASRACSRPMPWPHISRTTEIVAVLAVSLDGVGDVAYAFAGAAGLDADVERFFCSATETCELAASTSPTAKV